MQICAHGFQLMSCLLSAPVVNRHVEVHSETGWQAKLAAPAMEQELLQGPPYPANIPPLQHEAPRIRRAPG